MQTEADTCRDLILPLLDAAGWRTEPALVQEQRPFTDGRVIVSGRAATRSARRRADYLLRLNADTLLAVLEAKASYRSAHDGVQQAREYAHALGLRFAFSSNGHQVVEIDLRDGTETTRTDLPSPADLWARLRPDLGLGTHDAERQYLTLGRPDVDSPLRYYQEIAVGRALAAIVTGRDRALLNLCTGAGKTKIAFQICWRLWNGSWGRHGRARRPKILFLADRSVLVDDPKDKDFAAFGDARHKIEGWATLARDVYFSTYQAIAEDAGRPGLFRDFPRDFFDLVLIDECHRGSARAAGSWREILDWFSPAAQLGMTATPLREESRDTYAYFGAPLYTYSLAQGIEDGFLAPYRVHRVVTDLDATGWRPTAGELDRFGRPIPDDEYHTTDFERVVALRARTEAIARHLTDFLRSSDRFAKTIVFCVDQDHASEMRAALVRLNADLVARHPDYVVRVTADEGDVGRGHLERFKDVLTDTPTIVTTSQLLTTGVDVPTCRNVVLARVVGSMAEFKQIIGRGTRVREDRGKLWFNIIDYTGTATARFADPAFDGEPAEVEVVLIDPEGLPADEPAAGAVVIDQEVPSDPSGPGGLLPDLNDEGPRKLYVDGGRVEIVAHVVYDLDPDGRRLAAQRLTEWAGGKVRALFSPDAFRSDWAAPDARAEIVASLAARGVDLDALLADAGRPDDDPFDVLCQLAWDAAPLTRSERAARLRAERADVLDAHGEEARAVLEALLDRYAAGGPDQLLLPDALKVAPLPEFGNPSEIARRFGGAQGLREAVAELSRALYAA